jgi:hypothetical protein
LLASDTVAGAGVAAGVAERGVATPGRCDGVTEAGADEEAGSFTATLRAGAGDESAAVIETAGRGDVATIAAFAID